LERERERESGEEGGLIWRWMRTIFEGFKFKLYDNVDIIKLKNIIKSQTG